MGSPIRSLQTGKKEDTGPPGFPAVQAHWL